MDKKYIAGLEKKYTDEIVPALKEQFGYSSVMQTPRLQKIVLNSGVGQAIADKKLIEVTQEELSLDSRAEGCTDHVNKRHIELQASPRHAHWCEGNPTSRTYVRIPGATDCCCTTKDSRLQRCHIQVRRTWKLHHGGSLNRLSSPRLISIRSARSWGLRLLL